jgi:hypothetical protein
LGNLTPSIFFQMIQYCSGGIGHTTLAAGGDGAVLYAYQHYTMYQMLKCSNDGPSLACHCFVTGSLLARHWLVTGSSLVALLMQLLRMLPENGPVPNRRHHPQLSQGTQISPLKAVVQLISDQLDEVAVVKMQR